MSDDPLGPRPAPYEINTASWNREPWPPIDWERINKAISHHLQDEVFDRIREAQEAQRAAAQRWEINPIEALRAAKREIEEHQAQHNDVVAIEVGSELYDELRRRFSRGHVEAAPFWHIPMYRKPDMVGFKLHYRDGTSEDHSRPWDEEEIKPKAPTAQRPGPWDEEDDDIDPLDPLT